MVENAVFRCVFSLFDDLRIRFINLIIFHFVFKNNLLYFLTRYLSHLALKVPNC